jgi:arabinogalactan endo-1,4-beta-galactosidase
VLAACGSPTAGSPAVARPAFLGADISALERIEQAGGLFRDSGRVGDAIAILRERGANGFRLRLFVNPHDSDVQVNDLPYTLRLAARVKAAGAAFLLDLHYSDTWADPGHQTTPVAWATLGIDSLERQVETYSADVVTQLKQAGTLPGIVQVGNEIDGGILWPLGRVGGAYDTPEQWDHFTRLLKAAIRGVRSALSAGVSVRIMLHYSLGGSVGGTQWFVDHVNAHGVPYDLLGFSYYPWWHGSLAALRANLRATALRYGVDVMVVETAYPWRAGGWEGFVTNAGAMTWPVSRGGQMQFLADVVDAVATVPDNHGAAVAWWYPEAIPVSGLFVFAGGSLALFDSTGNVLPAASTFGAR